jgi:hypothetical protein
MNKLIYIAAALGLSMIGAGAQAATAAGNFDVNITLTSKCEINSTAAATGAVIGALNLAYTSFQATASTASTNFGVRCTTDLPFSMALDSASVTDGLTGIAYTLALSASSTHTATPAASLTGQVGVATGTTYYVHGNIAGGLVGTTTPGTDNKQRTLTVTY